MHIIFGRKKTAVLGAIKAQLPFSEGKYQLLNSWNTIPFRTLIFYHLNFQLPHPNRSNTVSSYIPLKAMVRYQKAELKLHSKPLLFLVGCP